MQTASCSARQPLLRAHGPYLDRRRVGRPGNEDNLVALALALVEFKVVHAPAAIRLGQRIQEVVVVRALAGRVDDDLRLGIVQLVHNILELLAQFELAKRLQAAVVHFDPAHVSPCLQSLLPHPELMLYVGGGGVVGGGWVGLIGGICQEKKRDGKEAEEQAGGAAKASIGCC